jgi:hypothetical protein
MFCRSGSKIPPVEIMNSWSRSTKFLPANGSDLERSTMIREVSKGETPKERDAQ